MLDGGLLITGADGKISDVLGDAHGHDDGGLPGQAGVGGHRKVREPKFSV
jgi:hypothetical protein